MTPQEQITQLQSEVADLQGQIRSRAHFDEFVKTAVDLGAKHDAIHALWKFASIKATGEPNKDELTRIITGFKHTDDYCFENQASASSETTSEPAPEIPPENPYTDPRYAYEQARALEAIKLRNGK